MFFETLIILKVILLGAVYGRLDGGGISATVSEWTERSLIMFFFVLACAPFAGLWALLAYAGVIGIATGQGQYFLALAVKKIKEEYFDFIVRPMFGHDPRTTGAEDVQTSVDIYGHTKLYWRCVFGLFVTGTIVGLPAFIISMVHGEVIGFVFLLTGVAKALAYMIGQKFFQSTVPAEYINGALRNVICLIVIFFTLSIN